MVYGGKFIAFTKLDSKSYPQLELSTDFILSFKVCKNTYNFVKICIMDCVLSRVYPMEYRRQVLCNNMRIYGNGQYVQDNQSSKMFFEFIMEPIVLVLYTLDLSILLSSFDIMFTDGKYKVLNDIIIIDDIIDHTIGRFISISFNIKSIKVIFYDDMRKSYIPMMSMFISSEKIEYISLPIEKRYNIIRCNCKLDYYNVTIGDWEPCLERCNFNLEYTKNINYKQRILYNDDIWKDFIPKNTIKISSIHNILINITPNLCQLLIWFIPMLSDNLSKGLVYNNPINNINYNIEHSAYRFINLTGYEYYAFLINHNNCGEKKNFVKYGDNGVDNDWMNGVIFSDLKLIKPISIPMELDEFLNNDDKLNLYITSKPPNYYINLICKQFSINDQKLVLKDLLLTRNFKRTFDNFKHLVKNHCNADSPPEVTSTAGPTSLPTAVEPSSNYLPLKSRATPGDRGEESETIHGSRGEVIKRADGRTNEGGDGMKSSTGPRVEPEADLREAKGEVNREAVCKNVTSGGEGHHGEWKGTTSGGMTSGDILDGDISSSDAGSILVPGTVASVVSLKRNSCVSIMPPLDDVLSYVHDDNLTCEDVIKNDANNKIHNVICEVKTPHPSHKLLVITSTIRIYNRTGIPLLLTFLDLDLNPIYVSNLKHRTAPISLLDKGGLVDEFAEDTILYKNFNHKTNNNNQSNPPEVTASVPLGVEPSSNYSSLKSRATPGDRGEFVVGDSGGKKHHNYNLPHELDNKPHDIPHTFSNGTEDVTSSGKPVADLREAEGEVNREGRHGEWKGTTSSGVGMTSGDIDGGYRIYLENNYFLSVPELVYLLESQVVFIFRPYGIDENIDICNKNYTRLVNRSGWCKIIDTMNHIGTRVRQCYTICMRYNYLYFVVSINMTKSLLPSNINIIDVIIYPSLSILNILPISIELKFIGKDYNDKNNIRIIEENIILKSKCITHIYSIPPNDSLNIICRINNGIWSDKIKLYNTIESNTILNIPLINNILEIELIRYPGGLPPCNNIYIKGHLSLIINIPWLFIDRTGLNIYPYKKQQRPYINGISYLYNNDVEQDLYFIINNKIINKNGIRLPPINGYTYIIIDDDDDIKYSLCLFTEKIYINGLSSYLSNRITSIIPEYLFNNNLNHNIFIRKDNKSLPIEISSLDTIAIPWFNNFNNDNLSLEIKINNQFNWSFKIILSELFTGNTFISFSADGGKYNDADGRRHRDKKKGNHEYRHQNHFGDKSTYLDDESNYFSDSSPHIHPTSSQLPPHLVYCITIIPKNGTKYCSISSPKINQGYIFTNKCNFIKAAIIKTFHKSNYNIKNSTYFIAKYQQSIHFGWPQPFIHKSKLCQILIFINKTIVETNEPIIINLTSPSFKIKTNVVNTIHNHKITITTENHGDYIHVVVNDFQHHTTHPPRSNHPPPEVQSNSSSTRRGASSNYLPVNGNATPGDRGEGDEEEQRMLTRKNEDVQPRRTKDVNPEEQSLDIVDVTSSGLPAADLREAKGEVNKGSCLQDEDKVVLEGRGKNGDEYRTSSGVVDDINNSFGVTSSMSLLINLSSIGVSLVSHTVHEELFFMELTSIMLMLLSSDDDQRIELRIGNIQIDNQYYDENEYNMIIINRGKIKNDIQRYFLQIYIDRMNKNCMDIYLKKVFIIMDDIQLYLSDILFSRIYNFYKECYKSIGKNRYYNNDRINIRIIDEWIYKESKLKLSSIDMIYKLPMVISLDYLYIDNFNIILWCNFEVDKLYMLGDIIRIGLRILSVSRRFELIGAPLQFQKEYVNISRNTLISFYEQIKDRYVHSALSCIGSILGYSSLLNIPKLPITVGKCTIEFAADAVDSVSNGLGNILSKFTFDNDYINKRQRDRLNNKTYHTMKEGFFSAGKSIGEGFLSLTNIVTKPIEGAQKEGMGGFIKGIGKGIAGSIVKPIDKVGQAVSHVSKTIKDNISKSTHFDKYTSNNNNCRPIRMLWGEFSQVKQYNSTDANIKQLLGNKLSKKIIHFQTILSNNHTHTALLFYPAKIYYSQLYNKYHNFWKLHINLIQDVRASNHGIIIKYVYTLTKPKEV